MRAKNVDEIDTYTQTWFIQQEKIGNISSQMGHTKKIDNLAWLSGFCFWLGPIFYNAPAASKNDFLFKSGQN
jgi:hypothetical protein